MEQGNVGLLIFRHKRDCSILHGEGFDRIEAVREVSNEEDTETKLEAKGRVVVPVDRVECLPFDRLRGI